MEKKLLTFEEAAKLVVGNLTPRLKSGSYTLESYDTETDVPFGAKVIAHPLIFLDKDGEKYSTLDVLFLNGFIESVSSETKEVDGKQVTTATTKRARLIELLLMMTKGKPEEFAIQFPTSKIDVEVRQVVDNEGVPRKSKSGTLLQDTIFKSIILEDCLVKI